MKNIALLIDLDNLKPNLEELERIADTHGGKIVYRRAFFNIQNTQVIKTAYGRSLKEFNYRSETPSSFSVIKQEVDHLIFQTTEELLNNSTLNIDMIAIVSNDNGYGKLFQSVKKRGIETIAIGLRGQMGDSLREIADHKEFLTGTINPIHVGIDLGTTNTVIAVVSQNLKKKWDINTIKVQIRSENCNIFNSEIIPSSVRFNAEGTEAEVGYHVKAQALAYPERTIIGWKHKMGCSVEGKPFKYEMLTELEQKKFVTPEECASKILAFCLEALNRQYKNNIKGVVITHPASYETDAVDATKKAAILAGLNENEIVTLSEPQGALYDFLEQLQKGKIHNPFADLSEPVNILVYDLGGGTLDVTLHQVQWDFERDIFLINDLAIGSRTRIGGDKIDELIVEYLIAHTPDYQKLSEADQKKLKFELSLAVEKFKEAWSTEYQYYEDKQNFNYLFEGIFLNYKFPIRQEITLATMREIIASVLCTDLSLDFLENVDLETVFHSSPFTDRMDTLVVPVLEVLLKAKQSKGEIPSVQAILLNGGMTYFPLVKERLNQLFPSIPILDDGDPDKSVARGAAIYGAGIMKSRTTINPNNLSLEVEENEKTVLRTLIKQGQSIPYKTVLSDFKLPNTKTGYLQFKIWEGMGNQPNLNTTLQRLRLVSMDKILDAKIASGTALDLEVIYTFDEKFLLTLVDKNNPKARFQLEVANDLDEFSTKNNPQSPGTPISPPISRHRQGQSSDPSLKIKFEEWENFANALYNTNNNNTGNLHNKKRNLARETSLASNRMLIATDLIHWLEIDPWLLGKTAPTKILLAVTGLTEVFRFCDPEDPQVKLLENKYKRCIRTKLGEDLNRINNQLLEQLVSSPGKLLWTDFNLVLMNGFKNLNSKSSGMFLIALGKCGKPDQQLLSFLKEVIRDTQADFSIKEKAFWALGRLISPKQPEKWRVQFNSNIQSITDLTLEQLYQEVKNPQVLTSLLGCLSCCLDWYISGKPLSPSSLSLIKRLPTASFPVDRYLPNFPEITDTFKKRIRIISNMINFDQITEKEKQEINNLITQVIQDRGLSSNGTENSVKPKPQSE